MKIIRPGRAKKITNRYRFECYLCGCVFECEDDEIRKEMDSHNDSMYFHDCPTCSQTISGRPIIYR